VGAICINIYNFFWSRDESSAGAEARGGKGLADLFQPPTELLFKGSFDDAVQHALEGGKWVVRFLTLLVPFLILIMFLPRSPGGVFSV
jgi:hypothetical protein